MRIIRILDNALIDAEKDYLTPLAIELAKSFPSVLMINFYELFLVEGADCTLSEDQGNNFILFRSDSRPPDEICKKEFMPKIKTHILISLPLRKIFRSICVK